MSLLRFLLIVMCAREAGSVDGILFDGGSRPCYWEEGHVWSASKKKNFENPVVDLKTSDGLKLCDLNLDEQCNETTVPADQARVCWCKQYKNTEIYEVFIKDIATREMSEKEITWENNGLTVLKEKLPPIYGKIKTRVQMNSDVMLGSVKEMQTVYGVRPNSNVAFYLCMLGLEKSAMTRFRLMVNGKNSTINTRLEHGEETCLLTRFRSSPPGRSTLVQFEYEEIGLCIRSGSYMIKIDGNYNNGLTGVDVADGVLEDGSSGNAGGVVAGRNTSTRYTVFDGVFGDYQDSGRAIVEIQNIGSSTELPRVSTSLLGTVVVVTAGFCL